MPSWRNFGRKRARSSKYIGDADKKYDQAGYETILMIVSFAGQRYWWLGRRDGVVYVAYGGASQITWNSRVERGYPWMGIVTMGAAHLDPYLDLGREEAIEAMRKEGFNA